MSHNIKNHLSCLSKYGNGWRKELNIVQWNDNQPKYDIRDWSPDHEKMSGGITLTESEIDMLASSFLEWFKGGHTTLETPDTFDESTVRYDIYAYLARSANNEKLSGWTLELNIVAWNEGALKADIRRWAPDHARMSRGVALTITEAVALCNSYREWKAKGVTA